jgi:chaperonin cofactor prefoldin
MREHEALEYRARIKKLEENNETLQSEIKGLRKELNKAMDKLEDLEGI